MTDKQLPFYAQTSILDKYIHNNNPKANLIALEIIIEMLQTRQDLRNYFFQKGPNAAWAEILWENGFFDAPPTPVQTEDGYMLPWWDVQQFLISIAGQVPNIAVKHAEMIVGDPIYIARAISTLQFVPPEKLSNSISRIIKWLKNPQIAQRIALETFNLLKYLAKQDYTGDAIRLFDLLVEPLPPSDVRDVGNYVLGAEVQSKFKNTSYKEELFEYIKLFNRPVLIEIMEVLKKHLITSLTIEAKAKGYFEEKYSSWWRSAIEETEQDKFKSYKDNLLEALRDSLERFAEEDKLFIESQIQSLLKAEYEILRRLGIHLLGQFPNSYPSLIGHTLGNAENLNDIGIHHEMFLLLQKGFPVLKAVEQKSLVQVILQGPPADYVAQLAKRAEHDYGEDPKQYIDAFSERWIRDRLWMIRDYLTPKNTQILSNLQAKHGEPEHPDFTHWTSKGFTVREIGPLPIDDLSLLSPDELVEFITQWKPEEPKRFGPEEISYTGLATDVANLIFSNYGKYKEHLFSIAIIQPQYAERIFRLLTDNEQAHTIPWDAIFSLIEQLLEKETVRKSIQVNDRENWVNVRRSIVWLLQLGLKNKKRAISFDHLERVKNILFILLYDPDPTLESDRPHAGWIGHNDPVTIAINHVRPNALITLIEYAHYRNSLILKAIENGNTIDIVPGVLELDVEQTLLRKLDRQEDSSWAVHSVYGRFLPILHSFNAEWVNKHLDKIFPENSAEEDILLFVSAWDSYVLFNDFYRPAFDIMRPKYERAIQNLANGLITETNLNPSQHLAVHIGQEYLYSNYDLHSSFGQDSLLVMFYEQALPEAHSGLSWWLWRECVQFDPDKLIKYWPRIRALWEWRIQKATVANHPNIFDKEMQFFAHLPEIAPPTENIDSMWSLLVGLLPHLARSANDDMGWIAFEDYLLEEVNNKPKQVAKLYRLMYEKRLKLRWFHNRPEIKSIIETAASYKEAKQEVLDLIDAMARLGIHDYRYIYEQLA